jgi:hypothetical protein
MSAAPTGPAVIKAASETPAMSSFFMVTPPILTAASVQSSSCYGTDWVIACNDFPARQG